MKAKLLLIMLCFTCFTVAQTPNIIGLKSNADSIAVVSWTLGDTEFQSVSENLSQNVFVASSFYDSYNQNYYYKSGQPNKLIKYELSTSDVSLSDLYSNNGLHETYIDIENGNYYVLRIISGQMALYQTDSSFDSLAFLGNYDLHISQAPYLFRSATYDSYNKNLYFIRLQNGERVLYKTDLAQDGFEYTSMPIVNLQSSGNIFLGFAEQANELYCAFLSGNFLQQTTMFNVGKIDTETGEYEEIMTVDHLKTIVNFNVGLDQRTNSFIVMGSDYDYQKQLYWINIDDETTEIYDMPDANLLEISTDNTIFASQFYSPLSTDGFDKQNTLIYPNPAKDQLTINSENVFGYKIYNNLGLEIASGKHLGKEQTLDIHHLKSGLYYMVMDNQETIKFIKQ